MLSLGRICTLGGFGVTKNDDAKFVGRLIGVRDIDFIFVFAGMSPLELSSGKRK